MEHIPEEEETSARNKLQKQQAVDQQQQKLARSVLQQNQLHQEEQRQKRAQEPKQQQDRAALPSGIQPRTRFATKQMEAQQQQLQPQKQGEPLEYYMKSQPHTRQKQPMNYMQEKPSVKLSWNAYQTKAEAANLLHAEAAKCSDELECLLDKGDELECLLDKGDELECLLDKGDELECLLDVRGRGWTKQEISTGYDSYKQSGIFVGAEKEPTSEELTSSRGAAPNAGPTQKGGRGRGKQRQQTMEGIATGQHAYHSTAEELHPLVACLPIYKGIGIPTRESVPDNHARFSGFCDWMQVSTKLLRGVRYQVPRLPGLYEWGTMAPDGERILPFYLGKAGTQVESKVKYAIFCELQAHGFKLYYRFRVLEDAEPSVEESKLLRQMDYAANFQLNNKQRQIVLGGNKVLAHYPRIEEMV
eukprot:gene30216-35204_t